jgi:hypothetical protein
MHHCFNFIQPMTETTRLHDAELRNIEAGLNVVAANIQRGKFAGFFDDAETGKIKAYKPGRFVLPNGDANTVEQAKIIAQELRLELKPDILQNLVIERLRPGILALLGSDVLMPLDEFEYFTIAMDTSYEISDEEAADELKKATA